MSLGERFASVLGAAGTGERWAWEAIYRELSPTVLGYLRAQGASEPGDLTGEVFLQVVRGLRTPRSGKAGDQQDVGHPLLPERHDAVTVGDRTGASPGQTCNRVRR